MRRLFFAALTLTVLALAPATAYAHQYDRDDSDHPLRLVAYVLNPIGIAMEYAVLRPIHWLVSQKNVDILAGHEAVKDPNYDYFAWEPNVPEKE